jgi:hypothetical protein
VADVVFQFLLADIPRRVLATGLAIGAYAERYGRTNIRPSLTTLARQLKTVRSKVQADIAEFTLNEVLSIRIRGGGRHATVYELNVRNLAAARQSHWKEPAKQLVTREKKRTHARVQREHPTGMQVGCNPTGMQVGSLPEFHEDPTGMQGPIFKNVHNYKERSIAKPPTARATLAKNGRTQVVERKYAHLNNAGG